MNILNRFIDEKFSQAENAGLNFSLQYNTNCGISININGFSQKLPLLIDIVTKELRKFNDYLDESVFDIHKTSLIESYKSSLKQGSFVNVTSDYLTNENYPFPFEYYLEAQKVTVEHLEKFVDKFFDRLYVKMFISGNLSKENALEISGNILSNISVKSAIDLSTIEQKSLKIPTGRRSIKFKSLQPNDKNSVAIEFFDLGLRTLRQDCVVDLFAAIFEEPVFDILRTKEQLAYSVNIAQENTSDSLSIVFYIKCQEDKHPARSTGLRLLQFVKEDMKKILDELTEEKYKKIQDSTVNLALIPFATFNEERRFYWNQITNRYYSFDHRLQQSVMYAIITKQHIIDFYNEMFVENSHRNLSIQLIGNANPEEINENDESEEDLKITLIDTKYDDEDEVITNLEEFKRGLEQNPSFKTTYHYD